MHNTSLTALVKAEVLFFHCDARCGWVGEEPAQAPTADTRLPTLLCPRCDSHVHMHNPGERECSDHEP